MRLTIPSWTIKTTTTATAQIVTGALVTVLLNLINHAHSRKVIVLTLLSITMIYNPATQTKRVKMMDLMLN